MKKDLVSVLMVNYNHADTIEKSIRSVLEQTYSKLQLIIVDDGSTDNSVEIINSIEDPRIELYEQKVNKQICMVTNFGMEKVKGEYFARIDSDDIWKNDKLQTQIDFLENNNEFKICFTHVDIIDEEDRIIDSELERLYAVKYEKQEEWLETFFFLGNCLPMSSVLMKTEIMRTIGKFNVCYRQLHDFDYWIRIAKIWPMAIIKKKLVQMRRYSDNTNNSNTGDINAIRTGNEYFDIRKHFFDNMSEELFKRTFKKYFKNENSSTKEELNCEKAFLLCSPCNPSNNISSVGIEYFMELLQEKRYIELLENKFDFSIKDFYDLTGKEIYFDYVLEKQLKEYQNECETLNRSCRNLNDEKEKLFRKTKELSNLVLEYKNSTSWKVTRPLRKISSCFRK